MQIKARDFLEYAAILMLILSSGGNPLVRSIYIYTAVCLLLLFYRPRMQLTNIWRLGLLLAYVVFNTCIVNTAPPIIKDVVILIARIIGTAIIASNISIENFKKKYINIMVFLCATSLFWYVLMRFGIMPPLSRSIGYSTASIFYTVWGSRNAGIFGEPGLFQIYINLTILFLIYDNATDARTFKKKFILLTITMLTAASAMGYLCYAVNLILCIKYRRELFGWISRHQKIRVFFIVLGLFLCVGAEISTHVFSNFITSWGSYTSRHDDTLMSFLISRDYPLFGVGIANDTGDVWQSYYGSLGKLELYHNPESLSRSNGFGNCLYTAGIPFTLLYMYMLLKHMKKVNSINSKIDMLLLLAMFLGFFFGEPFMFTPFFLGAFFKWHFNQNQRIRQYSTAGKYTSAG